MPNWEKVVLNVLGCIALALYLVSLVWVGWWPAAAKPHPMYEFLVLTITTISVTLATFVGVLLGLKSVALTVTNNVKGPAGQLAGRLQTAADNVGTGFGGADQLGAVVRQANQVNRSAGLVEASTQPSVLQLVAVGCYLLSLLFALVCWGVNKGDTDPTVVNLGKSLLGLIAGALAALLNGKAG